MRKSAFVIILSLIVQSSLLTVPGLQRKEAMRLFHTPSGLLSEDPDITRYDVLSLQELAARAVARYGSLCDDVESGVCCDRLPHVLRELVAEQEQLRVQRIAKDQQLGQALES